MELFSELLSSHHGFLSRQHVSMLLEFCRTPLAAEHYSRLVQGDDSVECVQLGLFLLALGDSRLDSLLSETNDSHSQYLLERLCGLLEVKGYPVVEDRLFVPAVEFWSTVVETVAEDVFADGRRGEVPVPHDYGINHYCSRAVHSACSKIMFPPQDIVSGWDSADREGFIDARKDVADLLQAMHAISGRDLVAKFSKLILQTMSNAQWSELEASAFCLGTLSDSVARTPNYDEFLAAVFSPEFFNVVQPSGRSVPMRTRQSCVALIEKYADYFERNTSSLPNALNLLFSVMDDLILGGPASKSILRLCRSCRPALVSEVDAFVAEYRTIVTERHVDCLANERIVGAIGAVIQAISDEEAQVSAVHQLLDVLLRDADACLLVGGGCGTGDAVESRYLYRCGSRCLADLSGAEIPLHTGIRVLRCLAAIGKGLQAPADILVDVDSRENELDRKGHSELLESIHIRIITVISELQKAFPDSGEIVEAICSVFRAGFPESTPGPFVFLPGVVGNYLTQHRLSTPRIGALLSVACSFVSSTPPQVQGWHDIMTDLMNWVIGLTRELPGTCVLYSFRKFRGLITLAVDSDPELSQNAIDFVCRVLGKDPMILLQLQQREPLVFFFTFTLSVLDGQEPLPKATAAEFWVSVVLSPPPPTALSTICPFLLTELGDICISQAAALRIPGNHGPSHGGNGPPGNPVPDKKHRRQCFSE